MIATPVRTVRRAAQQLRVTMAAVRVSFTWFGTRKTLTHSQKAQAAEPFGAEEKYLSAGKKLLDTSNPLFREVTSIRNRIIARWKLATLPYPEPGVRLIKQEDLQGFDQDLRGLKEKLTTAVERLDEHYESLKQSARERLGSLYAEADYPTSLAGLFDVSWEFPSVEPPEYLLRLNPELYQQERDRITARFDEAVRLAEEAFTAELSRLVGHLTERINGADGEKKVFRDSAIGNLQEFFSRFQAMNVHSNGQLDELVETAKRAVQGVAPQALRDSETQRRQLATQMSAVTAALDGMLVDAPRRRILRPVPPAQQVA